MRLNELNQDINILLKNNAIEIYKSNEAIDIY